MTERTVRISDDALHGVRAYLAANNAHKTASAPFAIAKAASTISESATTPTTDDARRRAMIRQKATNLLKKHDQVRVSINAIANEIGWDGVEQIVAERKVT